MKILLPLITSIGLSCLASCQENTVKPDQANWEEIKKSWSGAGELTSYDLKMNRYGVVREGTAVLVFVREPFLKDRQVKDESGRGDFQVLKMNFIREFKTGLYPYHTLTSVFLPLENKEGNQALKVTTSVQEWCGHTYMNTNRKNGSIQTELSSYFENEEGETFKTKSSVLLEDEIWTMIRLQPEQLPTGKVEMLAGNLTARLSHRKQKVHTAQASWQKGSSDENQVYQIQYSDSGRTLAIEQIDQVI